MDKHAPISQSSSFVAIDLYAQDSSEYMMACLLTAFVQTPILFCMSTLLCGPDHWSPYTVVMFVSGLQFVAIAFYFWVSGLKPFDVRSDVWPLLIVRSLLYCFAINMFVYSLEKLNPVSAMIGLHSGIIAATVIVRFVMREYMFYTMTIGKVAQIGIFLELCLIPGLATVKTEEFNDKFTINDYWFYLTFSIAAGMILGIVSRITSAMCGGGKLIHESYMTFWHSLITLVLAPLFFFAYI